MRRASSLVFGVAFGLTLLTAAPASAHFKLQQPADWLQTDSSGDPLGSTGTQKMNPCGDGTPSGIITKVHVNSTLHVKLTETVPHGGHYRIAIVPKLKPTDKDIPEPKVTLKAGECDSAEIQDPPVAPVVADNLFPHTQAQAKSGKVWETDVQMPADTGNVTLQIIEFMAPHAPSCFYHHCAQLELVPESEVIPDPNGDAGTTSSSGSSGSSSGTSGSNGSVTTSASSSGSSAPASSGESDSGCNTSGGAAPSIITMGAFGFVALSLARKKRRRDATKR